MIHLEKQIYQQTKDIFLGKSKRSPLLNEFSIWFKKKYSVDVLNFDFSKLKSPGINRYRLYVIVSDTEGYQKMQVKPFEYNKVYQHEIANEFRKLALKYKFANETKLENLFVAFNDFSYEAQTEANWKAAEEVKTKIKNKHTFVWDVIAITSNSVVFYYFDTDIENYKNNGVSQQITKEYHLILKKYDELNYFTQENISLRFDSKENLDKNYRGNLFLYTR